MGLAVAAAPRILSANVPTLTCVSFTIARDLTVYIDNHRSLSPCLEKIKVKECHPFLSLSYSSHCYLHIFVNSFWTVITSRDNPLNLVPLEYLVSNIVKALDLF